MFLGVFHPNNKDGKYMKINIPIMQKEAELMLDLRIKDGQKRMIMLLWIWRGVVKIWILLANF